MTKSKRKAQTPIKDVCKMPGCLTQVKAAKAYCAACLLRRMLNYRQWGTRS